METLTIRPVLPFALIIGLAAVSIGLMYGVYFLLRGSGSVRQRVRISLLTGLAAICFFIAGLNPVLNRVPPEGDVHLAVVVDVSDSVLRESGSWSRIQTGVSQLLTNALVGMDADTRATATASITVFRERVRTPVQTSLGQVPQAFRNLSENNFATGSGSRIGEGLDAAMRLIADSGRSGEILLITDGNEINAGERDVSAAVETLARQGIPVTVFPVGSRNPELSLTSLYLPDRVAAGTDVRLRSIIWNRGDGAASGQYTISQNTGLVDENLFGQALQADFDSFTLGSDDYISIAYPLTFQGYGLQYVDATLNRGTGNQAHQRRLFTHVDRPLQFLAIADDFRWLEAVDDRLIRLTQRRPSDNLATEDFSEYDGIILSAVPAQQMDTSTLQAIADAVTIDGTGLFFLNGGHRGAAPDAPTVLQSYEDTVLEPLLPVSPEPLDPDRPPSRQIVMFIDTSGSMCGFPLTISKTIAIHIIDNFLTEDDYLDLVAFTGGASHVVQNMQMTESNRTQAISRVNSLGCGGGTNPTTALTLLRDKFMSDCGLIFLSDGGFSPAAARTRPDCHATVFSVGASQVPQQSPLFLLADYADVIGVGRNFDVNSVAIPYFEQRDRENPFAPGCFPPLSTDIIGNQRAPVPMPDLPLFGSAEAYAKPWATVSAFRPKLVDPILTYGDRERGRIAVLGTEVPLVWLGQEQFRLATCSRQQAAWDFAAGRAAVNEWLLAVVAYSARDRYVFEVEDDGGDLFITLSVQDEAGQPPDLSQVEGEIEVAGDGAGVTWREVADSPATYETRLSAADMSRENTAQQATLLITEYGNEGLLRPQRIPLLIPPAGSVGEAAAAEVDSFGINAPLLRQVVGQTGGTFLPQPGYTFFSSQVENTILRSFWRVFVLAGTVFYVLAIAAGKFK